MSKGFRLAFILVCLAWVGTACSRTGEAGMAKSAAGQSVIENAGELENSGLTESKEANPIATEIKAKRPAGKQAVAGGKYADRVKARQEYLKRRRAWIAAHQDQFHALP